jgi:hypothetical protein
MPIETCNRGLRWPHGQRQSYSTSCAERRRHVQLNDGLDDIRKAGFLNLVAKANRTHFQMAQANSPSVVSFIQELVELRGDRFLAIVRPELRSATVNSLHQDLFHEVSEALQTPPPGFAADRSFKTLDHYGNLQLSFFSSVDGKVALDMDIDDAQGFDHIFQVVGNFLVGRRIPTTSTRF